MRFWVLAIALTGFFSVGAHASVASLFQALLNSAMTMDSAKDDSDNPTSEPQPGGNGSGSSAWRLSQGLTIPDVC